jgi:small-conductance mechanosensitive channel
VTLAPISLALSAHTLPLAADPSAGPTPAVGTSPSAPACQANALCDFIYHQTGQGWLAESSYYLLIKPLRIVAIIVIALVLRHIGYKMIRRLTETAGTDLTPGVLRPLRERIPTSVQEVAGLRSERRRQRARALGSVLRSGVTTVIFAVAAMMILAELGVNLAPLLASAGIAGVALGFGAQNLVKDFIAGLFMLLEDQYGVGDVVDAGDVNGTVEAVGLRVTTIRDPRGVLWYLRNGEIVRVGNRSQGWALVAVDVPVSFGSVDQVTAVLRTATASLADDPAFVEDFIEPPVVAGVEQITLDGAVVRVTAKTTAESHHEIGRELRRRLTEAIESAGISAPPAGPGRAFVRTQSQVSDVVERESTVGRAG